MQSLLIRLSLPHPFNACKILLVCYNKRNERFLMCGSVSSLRRIKNSFEEEAVTTVYGLFLFYKLITYIQE